MSDAPISLSVLVVDDNRNAADSLARFLDLNGHAARTAYSGVEGVRMATATGPTSCSSTC